MDKKKPMHNYKAASNTIPIVESLYHVDDPALGDMVIAPNEDGDLKLFMATQSAWTEVGSDATGNASVLDAGDITDIMNPSEDTWGSPTGACVIFGNVIGEFLDAPNGIDVGEYVGVLIKDYSPNFSRISYLTNTSRQFQRMKVGGVWKDWVETSVSSKQAIWTINGNDQATVRTSTDISQFDDVVIDITQFDAVEQDFLGNLTTTANNKLEFIAAHANAYEIQIHGTISEPSATFTSMLLIQIFDEATGAPMTGSLQSIAPAWTFNGDSYFSFNCTGFARLNTSDKVKLQISSTEATSYTLNDCIVTLRPLD
tara:strand:- start:251 stop:1189 length:939 start_codon:yes stop_codon:yes gene_type:complete